MAMEPSRDDGSITMLAMIVGGLAVAVVGLFAFGGGFQERAPEKATISIDAPAPTPAPAPAAPSAD